MQKHRDSVVLGAEDPLALRRQIDQLQEHIDLLMMESAIIQEQRSLLQQQQDIKLPAVTEKMQELDHLCDEVVDPNMKESYADSVSGLPFASEGAKGFQVSRPYLGSTAVIFSDRSVVVQTQPQSRGSTSKLRAKLRDMMAAHRRLQSTVVPHEPPALFQGLVGYL